MTPEEMFRKLEYLPDVQIEEYELEGAVDTDLTLPAGHVIMTRFGHVEWGGIRRRTYVWEYGEEATEYYLCNPRSDTPHSHRFVARSSLRLISPEDAETTAEQPAVRAEAAEEERAELRAANEALAERVAELEAQVASADDETASASAQAARYWYANNKLAERVAELEAQLEEATQLLSIAIDRLPEEEQEIVALRWALSGTFTNELPTIAAPAPQEPTP